MKIKTERLSIVLASGGLDSAVTTAIAAKEGRVALLHANYGQLTEARELKAFNAIADFYDIKERLTIDIEHLRRIGGSALTDPSIAVPTGDVDSKAVPVTYVPFRNAHFLASAVSWAEVLKADSIYIGAVEADSSGYPDCTREFFLAFQTAINTGTKPETKITIKMPLIDMTKAEIVRLGVELNAPLELTWSCYKDSEVPCGNCDSCLLRLRGFNTAGVRDPITP
ncbi:MAG: 7-cyano-7-deazaguanine synthase QueC [Deltaproteobacteria bacterium]|nr:7-cyano-7-deazaguanine synthase QueC [Deltaproteobacteria bacterium]